MKQYPSSPNTIEPIALYKAHESSIINVAWLSTSGASTVSVPDRGFAGDAVIAGRVEVAGSSVSSVPDDAFLTGISIQFRSFGASVAWTEIVFVAQQDAYVVPAI